MARKVANQISTRTLIIQGAQDEVVNPKDTRWLAQRLPASATYIEVAAGHDLLNPDQPAWSEVEAAILDYAQSLEASEA